MKQASPFLCLLMAVVFMAVIWCASTTRVEAERCRLCGGRLQMALSILCNGSYSGKRSYYPSLWRQRFHFMYKRLPFRRARQERNAVDDCCRNRCNISQIAMYCLYPPTHQGVSCSTLIPGLPTTTTVATPPTTTTMSVPTGRFNYPTTSDFSPNFFEEKKDKDFYDMLNIDYEY